MPDSSEAARDRFRGYALVVLAASCWASGGLTAKWLFTQASAETASWPVPPLGVTIEPTVLSGARALTAFLILLLYVAARRRQELKVRARDLLFLGSFGVFGIAAVHFTYFMTISLTNVATAILLEYLAPVLVLVVGVAFLGHRFTWALPAGVFLSITGCALVVGAIGGDGLVVSPAGVAWGLASAVFFAVYSLMGSVAVGRFSPYTTLLYGLGFASAFWLVWLGPSSVLSAFGSVESAAAVLFVAVVGTVIPFSAFLSALHHISPTNATVTSTIEPVIAGIGAYVLFGEALSLGQLVGGLLVLAAIAIVQWPDRGPISVLPPPD